MGTMERYILTAASALFTFTAVYLAHFFHSRWLFWLIIPVWLAVLLLAKKYQNRRRTDKRENLEILLLIAIAFLTLLIIVEGNLWQLLVTVWLSLTVAFLFYLPPAGEDLLYKQKPARRLLTMMLVFAFFAFSSAFYAVSMFFSSLPFWLLGLAQAVMAWYISLRLWQMYFAAPWPKLVLRACLISLAVWEISWVISLWPLGYLALGFLLTWIWYVLQLLIRFYLTGKGVIWEKQWAFLAGNLILCFLILFFFVKWL